ncbi:MAG: hypothetical protein L0Y72_13240 [Gemmataceae bacterium]|nr:hypothetical protein [Gemmataceae bacterium]
MPLDHWSELTPAQKENKIRPQDNAVVIYWNPLNMEPGASRTMSYGYGLGLLLDIDPRAEELIRDAKSSR